MALLMAAGSEPANDEERGDLDAIAALKESAAIELKVQGNKHVKSGKQHYSEAIDCYSRAINQNALNNLDQSILFSNRAHVNLMLGNFKRALLDGEQAIGLCPTNVKAYFRAAKAALSLELLNEAQSFCIRGLEQFPSNEEMKKLSLLIDSRKKEHEHKKNEHLKVVDTAKALASAFKIRGLKIGKAMYEELTGVKTPYLDESGTLRWPVLFLYPETMSSDFVEEFCETDIISDHLNMMYTENCSTLPWDKEKTYTREAIELYYQADRGELLSKRELLEYLLQDTTTSFECGYNEDMDEVDHIDIPSSSKGSGKWIKVNERKTLSDILKQPTYIIPAIPVFFVISKRSSFYSKFIAGNWSPP